MKHVLLLGAGFTRNWGGWLAAELVGDLLGRLRTDPEIRQELQECRAGFESVLGDLQASFRLAPSPRNRSRLQVMQNAVLASFADMNEALADLADMEFAAAPHKVLQRFMGRFDAIFTLNQDLMLEMHYDGYLAWADDARFKSEYFPGLERPELQEGATARQQLAVASKWRRIPAELDPERQPVFKLHGSVNWRTDDGTELVVMGTGKAATIRQDPLLRWYFDAFESFLSDGGTKVMAIGYGFGDTHINELLLKAARDAGLQLFIVDPRGTEIFKPPAEQLISARHDMLAIPIIGESRRPLSSTFYRDTLERAKLMRFFD